MERWNLTNPKICASIRTSGLSRGGEEDDGNGPDHHWDVRASQPCRA
jgi:hypothetical protein